MQEKEKTFFHSGFQLGRAKDVDRFNNTVTSLEAEITSAEAHQSDLVQKTIDAVNGLLHNFGETAKRVDSIANGMVQKHLQFVRQLEIETAIWAAMQPPPGPEYYVEQRNKVSDIFKKTEEGFDKLSAKLDEQVHSMSLSNMLEKMVNELKAQHNNTLETMRANLREFRKGYNEGAGIRQQLDDLDGGSSSPAP